MAQVLPKEVTYAVRTRQYPRNQKFVTPLDASAINPSNHVIFITHGWTAHGNDSWILNLTNAYLNKGAFNIIAVNWHNPANQLYPASARNTKDVGMYIN